MNTPEARLNWFYQGVPRDEHDWDLATAPTLYRTPAEKDMLAIAGKSGRVYVIDRATQALAFNTPATTVAHDEEPLDQTWKLVYPSLQGGTLFNGTASHPGTGALYVGMSAHCTYYTKNAEIPPHGGAGVKDFSRQPQGWITAIDGETGEVLWKYNIPHVKRLPSRSRRSPPATWIRRSVFGIVIVISPCRSGGRGR